MQSKNRKQYQFQDLEKTKSNAASHSPPLKYVVLLKEACILLRPRTEKSVSRFPGNAELGSKFQGRKVEDMLLVFGTGHYRVLLGPPGGLQSIHSVNVEFCFKLD